MLNEVMLGDALVVMKKLSDQSIDLILTDPPYGHRTKNCWWDRQWNGTETYIGWLSQVADQWKRLLKINGSLYCFASSQMAAHVEVMLNKKFDILNHIVWEKQNDPGFDGWKQKCSKESLRRWYPNSERIIFAEQNSFGKIFREARIKAGLTAKDLAEMIGAYGKVNHGGSVSNWETGKNIPTTEQYDKLQKILDLPPMEKVIRHFSVNSRMQYTDVWHFDTVKPYKGKHSCEKPGDLIRHIIQSSSKEGDVVMDCFCGSGVVPAEAKALGRHFIAIEIEENWAEATKRRINENKVPQDKEFSVCR